MTMHTIPPHQPDALRFLLPTDDVAVVPFDALRADTVADLAKALPGAAGAELGQVANMKDAQEHIAFLNRRDEIRRGAGPEDDDVF